MKWMKFEGLLKWMKLGIIEMDEIRGIIEMDEIRDNTPRGSLKWMKFGIIHGVDIVSLLTKGELLCLQYFRGEEKKSEQKEKMTGPGGFNIFVGN